MGDVLTIGGERLGPNIVDELRQLAADIESGARRRPDRVIVVLVDGLDVQAEYYGQPTNVTAIVGELQCAILDIWANVKLSSLPEGKC